MAPPPSQAGRFKPRKPAKKITVGDTTAGAAAPAPDAVSSSLAGRSGSRGGGTGAGGRDGRGRRGGRDGGRGRGRAPIPQGQAFFTAQPAPTTSSARQRRLPATSGAASGSQSQNTQQLAHGGAVTSNPGARGGGVGGPDEEIVGTLESAIGSMVPASVKSSSDGNKSFRDPAQMALEYALFGDQNGMPSTSHGPEGYMYDSDSSREEHMQHTGRHARGSQKPVQMPLSLPFPPVSQSGDELAASDSRNHAPSPFVSNGNQQQLEQEMDSWFLVQLPTRLPLVQQQAELKSEDDMMVDGVPSAHEDVATVATSPMQMNAFDNTLTNAVPGRIGKIKVYKSGKTVLVLEGADGLPTMTMNISEGLSCGFQQQAVVIDVKDGRDYVPLGPVRTTVVVTPDLKGTV